jgi:hypothetical protein
MMFATAARGAACSVVSNLRGSIGGYVRQPRLVAAACLAGRGAAFTFSMPGVSVLLLMLRKIGASGRQLMI